MEMKIDKSNNKSVTRNIESKQEKEGRGGGIHFLNETSACARD
jgi:hypothetical protein